MVRDSQPVSGEEASMKESVQATWNAEDHDRANTFERTTLMEE